MLQRLHFISRGKKVKVYAAFFAIFLIAVKIVGPLVPPVSIHKLQKPKLGGILLDDNRPLVLEEAALLQGNGSGKLNAVIVEEHHEVLPYWFGAVERKIIKKSGNVLIHFDGHSDLAPPAHIPGMAGFGYPKTMAQFEKMLQRNDNFILLSAMAGMFSQIIWVAPPWALAGDEFGNSLAACSLELGVFNYTEFSVQMSSYCVCYTYCVGIDLTGKRSYGCTFMSASLTIFPESYEGVCSPKQTVSLKVIQGPFAETHLAPLLKKSQRYILDIDEDYFGSAYYAGIINDDNIPWPTVKRIDGFLEEIFCLSHIRYEEVASAALVKLVKYVTAIVSQEADRSQLSILFKEWLFRSVLGDAAVILEKWRKENLALTSLLCKDGRDGWQVLDELTEFLLALPLQQLQVIVDTQFCFKSTFRRYYFDLKFMEGKAVYEPDNENINYMNICHGWNTWQVTNVIHMPTETQIHETTSNVRTILKNLPVKPDLITICRSNRDGFVPRKWQKTIESSLLNSLSSLFKNVHYIYDKFLMTYQ